MRSVLLFIVLFAQLFVYATGQELSKITLKSGSSFRGVIVMQNDEMLMLKDSSGARFQFLKTEIQKIEQLQLILQDTVKSVAKQANTTNQLISAQIFASTGYATIVKATDKALYYDLQLNFGKASKHMQNMYTGVGIGYISVVQPETSFGLVPLSYTLQTTTSENRKSFFWGFSAGYALSTNKSVNGGLFSQLSAGLKINLQQKNAFLVSLQTSVFGIETNLSEQTPNGTYGYNGHSSLFLVGLKTGFQF
jgi:hypothetical protein